MTTAKAAAALELSIKSVQWLTHKDILIATWNNGRLDIAPEEVERYKQERRQPGRPKKQR